MKKSIPIGRSDFQEIIERNHYYVDKTLFIDELIKKDPKVLLLTRPRRFGKTLTMSMLKYFFDIKGGEKNRGLFNGLNIEKTESISHQGKYPVIFLTMKDMDKSSFEEFKAQFRDKIWTVYNEYEAIRERLNEKELKKFDEIWGREKEASYDTSIKFLSELLYKYVGTKPVILIDEYDAPMIYAHEKGYYKDAKELIGSFYGTALKDGISSFAVITGILKIAKESIFSTLNNLDVSTILTGDYNYFGMTEQEVMDILKYYGWETTMKDTREWYNGYLFGKEKVYNPWSILKHCEMGKLEAFWINTSTNILIKEILRDADEEISETMYTLLKNGTVKVILDESMTFEEEYSDSTLLYLMFSAGYLTIDSNGEEEDEYYLTIPNREVRKYFSKTFIEIMTTNSRTSFSKLERALLDGDVLAIEQLIERMFLKTVSYVDISKEERFYHNIIMVMMSLIDSKFYVHSNRESGRGRYDLALEPKDKNGIGYIFEFKVYKTKKPIDEIDEKVEENMEKLGLEALEQIDRKIYEQDMRTRGIKQIVKIGMVFSGKIARFYTR